MLMSSTLPSRSDNQSEYHLYSPAETVERAKSRIGENRYNLVTNNCEHFAIWCKTGVSESHQVKKFLESLDEPRIHLALGGI
jgi:hypothetical protein